MQARSAAEMPVVTPQRASTAIGEGGAEVRVVALDHERDAQLVEPLGRHGNADEAARVAGHEVDGLGVDELGGQREVALVLALLRRRR